MKQKEFAKKINVNATYVSMIFSGKRKVSFPLALKLHKLFPERDVEGWKNATPEEIKELMVRD